MPRAGKRKWLVVFERATVTEDDYGGEVETWAEYARRRVDVRFGTAQEKREAAQEGGVQTATFHCKRSAELDAVTLEDRLNFMGSAWDITETAPLSLEEIRFTGTRNV